MNKFTDLDDTKQFKAGQKVRCIRTQYYFMGQGGERIARGRTRIIEAVRDGRLFFREDPARYGPWDPAAFRLVEEQLDSAEIADRAAHLGVEGRPSPVDANRCRELIMIAASMKPGERRAI